MLISRIKKPVVTGNLFEVYNQFIAPSGLPL